MSNGDYGYFGKGDTGYAQYMTAFNRNFGGSSGGGGGGGGAAVLIGVGAAAAITAGVIMMSPVEIKGRVVLADHTALPLSLIHI